VGVGNREILLELDSWKRNRLYKTRPAQDGPRGSDSLECRRTTNNQPL